MIMVKHPMSAVRNTLLGSLCLAVLAACATGETVDRRYEPDVGEIRRMLGCGSDQVAVCIEVNCEPADYVCAARGDFRDMFEPRVHH